MTAKILVLGSTLALVAILYSCAFRMGGGSSFDGSPGEVKLMTLDPGHFHAALVQKSMYEQVSPEVHVYGPDSPDVKDHLKRIEGFNSRDENPTAWEETVYLGDDFFARLLEERPGNVVVLSGNNRKKAEYIRDCAEAGLNVLADKPMCINAEGFALLQQAFEAAEAKEVLLYDIMTERFEITSILQKELAAIPEVFGEIHKGTTDHPTVVKESVHHFSKEVAGKPLKRPPWFFDTAQQGEGLVDVTTHLVDLAMWGLFPGRILDYDRDVKMKKAQRWPTLLSREQFQQVTGLDDFPAYLKKDLDDQGRYPCYANGEMVFALRGIHVRLCVKWNFQAPAGAKDTHYSLLLGSKAAIFILQGKDQNYKPELYVEPAENTERAGHSQALERAVTGLQEKYPGIELEYTGERWHIKIPDKYRIGHEAHFGQVTKKYLEYLEAGELPEWEVPNMLVKYRITSEAMEMALK